MSEKRLVVSIHDVTPRHWDRIRQIEDLLHEIGLEHRYSMLVVPDYWREWPVHKRPDFCDWLRGRTAMGIETVLHGMYHRDELRHPGPVDRWRASTWTNREGEFLGLPYEEAVRRISTARDILCQIIGRPIRSFVAPAWLYGGPTLRALEELGFDIAEDQLRIWSPARGQILSRIPVISYASRSRSRIRASLAWSKIATVLLNRGAILRVALHPADFDIPALVAETRRVLTCLMAQRNLVRYCDLVTPPST